MLQCCASKRDDQKAGTTSEHENDGDMFRSKPASNITPLTFTPGSTSGSSASSLRRPTVIENMSAFSMIEEYQPSNSLSKFPPSPSDGVPRQSDVGLGVEGGEARGAAAAVGDDEGGRGGGQGGGKAAKNITNPSAIRGVPCDQDQKEKGESGSSNRSAGDGQNEEKDEPVIKIQARHRGNIAREQAAKKRKSIIQVQAQARGKSTRKKSRFDLFHRKKTIPKTENAGSVEGAKEVPTGSAVGAESIPSLPPNVLTASVNIDFDSKEDNADEADGVRRCPNGHMLKAYFSQYEWICNECKAIQKLGSLVHTCHHSNPESFDKDLCDYDVCDACCKLNPSNNHVSSQTDVTPQIPYEDGPPHLRCLNHHNLHKHISSYAWQCNRCKSAQPEESFVYTCDNKICDYHVCEDCCMDKPSDYDFPSMTPEGHDDDGHYYIL